MSTDRRFFLLLACAFAAFLALSIATGRETRRTTPQASSGPMASSLSLADAAALSGRPFRQPPVLRPLLTVSLTERFPRLAHALISQRSLLPGSQIVSYYGNPATSAMGILGRGDLETVVSQLERQAAWYDRLNGPLGVVPALHLVYAVAQYHPTDNGLYLQYADDADVRRLIELTEERGMLLFLDLQIGRSSVEAELEKVLPYLRYPQVHLAIDPEFAVSSPEVPGADLGSLDGADIDRAQAILQRLVQTEHLPPKLLIVHQFVDSMVRDGEAIRRYPGVELILDMDGFGPAAVKRVKYQQYAGRPYASYGAIKLFFEHDPDLMSEEDVLSLEPTPAIVIYQ